MRRTLVVASEYGYTASVKSTESIQTKNGAGMHVVLRFEGPYLQDTPMKELTQVEDITVVNHAEQAELG